MNTAMYKKVLVRVLPIMWVVVLVAGVAYVDMAAHRKLDDGGGSIAVNGSGDSHKDVLKGTAKWAMGRLCTGSA